MKRGTKPQASEMQTLKGNPGHRPIAPIAEVEQIADATPSWPKSKGARDIWSKLMPLLRPLRFVKATDEIVVACYPMHLAPFIELNEKITKADGGVLYTRRPTTARRGAETAVVAALSSSALGSPKRDGGSTFESGHWDRRTKRRG